MMLARDVSIASLIGLVLGSTFRGVCGGVEGGTFSLADDTTSNAGDEIEPSGDDIEPRGDNADPCGDDPAFEASVRSSSS
jgi:hypothetical protein